MLTAEQFNRAAPEVRAFYQGFIDRYLWMYRPNYTEIYFGEVQLNPTQLANRVLHYQWMHGLTQDINRPTILPDNNWGDPPASIPYDASMGTGYFNQYTNLAFYEPSALRPKYRVRKSYWTGASRRRRNLTA